MSQSSGLISSFQGNNVSKALVPVLCAGVALVCFSAGSARAATSDADLKAQVDALSQQLQALQAQMTTLTTQNAAPPTTLPAITTVRPYTRTGVATPGSTEPQAGLPVASGTDVVHVTLSGNVNRALLYGNDGVSSSTRNVDNNAAASRIRIVGEGRLGQYESGGVDMEIAYRINSSATQSLVSDEPGSATIGGTGNGTFLRQIETYFNDTRLGGVRLGFGSTASYLVADVDQSDTAIVSEDIKSDFDGGFQFRQDGAALVPTAPTKVKGVVTHLNFVKSPDAAYGPDVAAVLTGFDGMIRENRIRYDSPVYAGFQIATSFIDGGAWDASLRYAAHFGDNGVLEAGFAYSNALGRSHVPFAETNALPYGYGGSPTASGYFQAGSGDNSANGTEQYIFGATLLFDSGINFTAMYAYKDANFTDPNGLPIHPTDLYLKAGYKRTWFDIGQTAFSAEYTQNQNLQFNGDNARSYSVQLVQNIDKLGMNLFLSPQYQVLDRTYGKYHPLEVAMAGMNVRF